MSEKNRQGAHSQYHADQVASFFDAYGMREWDRLVQTPNAEVSLYIHQHYLEKYISRGQRVLEIGAGAGRFTQYLAELGASVVVADISPGQLDLNKKHAQQYGYSQAIEAWEQIDICEMSKLGDGSFDRVVAYGGAFSYVLDRRDQALAECIRVLKGAGLLLLSVISLWGAAHGNLIGVLETPVDINRRITETGDILPGMMGGRGQFFHMFRAGELRSWLEQAGLQVLDISASDCLSMVWGEKLNEIRKDPVKWNELLRMELMACSEEGSLNMGMHTIAAAQKST
ncbi:MAG: class I SAM-dependent methyltransferase [Omnitrophica WOR_2 bacterium]